MKAKTAHAIGIAALVICILIALGGGAVLGWRMYNEHLQETGDERMQELAYSGEKPQESAPAETPVPEEPVPSAEPEPEIAEAQIDFDALHAVNEEIFAWIRVDGTQIDYPVLCRPEDDDYYHTHTPEHKRATAGSIYMQGQRNSMDLTDFNTIFYGHNMRSGSMFAGLHSFENQEFFDAHDQIVVFLPGKQLTYTIFAAYQRDNLHLLRRFPCRTEEERTEYIEDIQAHKGHFRDGAELNTDSRILTLSTCIGGQKDRRWIVQGVLTEEIAVEN